MPSIIISLLILALGFPNHMAEAAIINVLYAVFYIVSHLGRRHPLTKRHASNHNHTLSLR